MTVTSKGEELRERVYEAVATLRPDDSAPIKEGQPGVSKRQLAKALDCSEKTIERALNLLIDTSCVQKVGTLSNKRKVFGAIPLRNAGLDIDKVMVV